MFPQRIAVWVEVSIGKRELSGYIVLLLLSQVPGLHEDKQADRVRDNLGIEIHCLFLSGKWESSVAKRFFFFNVPSCMWEYSRFSDWEFPFVKCLAGGCRDDLLVTLPGIPGPS